MKDPDVVTVVEPNGGRIGSLDLEVLAVGRKIAQGTCGKVIAVWLGANIDSDVGRDLIAHGADMVFIVRHELLEPYQADAWLPDLYALISDLKPNTVLIPHTSSGADFGPRLAFRLGSSIITSCEEVNISGDGAQFTRACYGGNARETISFKSEPAVVTIKSRAFVALPRDDERNGNVMLHEAIVKQNQIRTRVVERLAHNSHGLKLEDASIIVAGGRGIGGAEGFSEAKEMAEALGGAVGASRVACDLGWCPTHYQIGLSGKTVAPDLYIALGISGASHHMAGCGKAKTIVAINTDEEADIFSSARFGVIGDCRALLPHLIEEIRQKVK